MEGVRIVTHCVNIFTERVSNKQTSKQTDKHFLLLLDAIDGYMECYDYNRGGTIYGNCGENGQIGAKTYTQCSRE